MIVHHRTIEAQFRENQEKSGSNKTEMERLVNNRNGLPDYFKMHINKTLIGFEKSLGLISEK